MRAAITLVALVFIGALAALTVFMLLREGPNVLTGLSVIVVALLAFGILGALTEPPNRRR
jgi:hypothetical protein